MEKNKNSRSVNDLLQTPQYILSALGTFDLDPCAGEFTKIGKVNLWDGRNENGLGLDWNSGFHIPPFVWCNPPFSKKEIWIEKMKSHGNGILVLPERGSAPWFGPLAKYCGKYFVMGKKINFIGGPSSNNLGSVLFPFGDLAESRIETSNLPGHFVTVNYFRSR